MNLTSPIPKGAVHAAELPGDSVASFLKAIGTLTGLFADDGADGALGMLMSGLSGVAAALAVAIFLTVYFRSGYRSYRDVVRHGLAATLVLGLLAFVAYDMRHAALAFLGINPAKPAVEFEIRLPKAAVTTDRVVMLNLPGQPQFQFKLRLPASPSRSERFGPWHLADHVGFPGSTEAIRSSQSDAFAIRYRVM